MSKETARVVNILLGTISEFIADVHDKDVVLILTVGGVSFVARRFEGGREPDISTSDDTIKDKESLTPLVKALVDEGKSFVTRTFYDTLLWEIKR